MFLGLFLNGRVGRIVLLEFAAVGQIGQAQVVLGIGDFAIKLGKKELSELEAGLVIVNGFGVSSVESLQVSLAKKDLCQIELEFGFGLFFQCIFREEFSEDGAGHL